MRVLSVYLLVAVTVPTLSACIMIPIPYKGYRHSTVSGYVQDAQTGQALTGAVVSFLYPHGDINQHTSTDRNGNFLIQSHRSQWMPGYILFLLLPIDQPFSVILLVEKPGFETAVVQWPIFKHRSWVFNAHPFERHQKLSPIVLKPGDPEQKIVFRTETAEIPFSSWRELVADENPTEKYIRSVIQR